MQLGKIARIGGIACLATGALLAIAPGATAAGAQSGTVTGTVFRDYDWSGSRNGAEPGEPGIPVRAFDDDGDQVGAATSGADGTYTLAVNNAKSRRVRIEFGPLPSYLRPGPRGAGNGTTVQFVTLPSQGPAANVNTGVVNPTEFCQTNPDLATPCYVSGDPLAAVTNLATEHVLVSFPDSATGSTPPRALADAPQIGSTWALAWDAPTRRLFSAAVLKRHTGLGPLGLGGIYVTTFGAGGTSTTTPFVDVTTLGVDVGSVLSNPARGLAGDKFLNSVDASVYGQVAKVGIGGMDLSEDGSTLWFVNLNTRQLVGIPTTNPTAAGVRTVSLPLPQCTNGQARPWALRIKDGRFHVGVVCSAEAPAGTRAQLTATVLRSDGLGTNPSWSPIISFPLDYTKGCARNPFNPFHPTASAYQFGCRWNPWRDTYVLEAEANDIDRYPIYVYVQPVLTAIEFDPSGALLLGFMDRNGMQNGHRNNRPTDPPGDEGNTGINANVGGDLLRARRTGTGTWTLESNGSDGLVTTAGANNGQGPGGGEYYFDEYYFDTHDETAFGAIAQLVTSGRMAATVMDPIDADAGGLRWFSHANGAGVQSYQLYFDAGFDVPTFGKAVGLGDLQYLCDAAPIEVGNRVWRDDDRDGIQDAEEPPLAGVVVQLVRNGAVIGTATTGADGSYYFGGIDDVNLDPGVRLLGGTSYTIRIPNVSGASKQAALAGLDLTGALAGANRAIDSDGQAVGTSAEVTFTTGRAGDNDHTFDFGFAPPPPVVTTTVPPTTVPPTTLPPTTVPPATTAPTTPAPTVASTTVVATTLPTTVPTTPAPTVASTTVVNTTTPVLETTVEPGGQLPETGTGAGRAVVSALLMIGGGVLLIAGSRRRPAALRRG